MYAIIISNLSVFRIIHASVKGEFMKSDKKWALTVFLASLTVSPAMAATTTVRGKIVSTQGHEYPACRTVILKRSDTGALMWFRIPATGTEDGILATTLTAVTTGLEVSITYDSALTTGCGAEPKILYIGIFAPGF
jgi:hypothetical protein